MVKQIKQRLKNMQIVSGLLSNAERIANEMSDQRPAAEHLVLASFQMSDQTAITVFREIAGEPVLFKQQLEKQQDQVLRDVGIELNGLDISQHDASVAPAVLPGAQISAQQVLREMAGKTSFWAALPVTGLDVLSAVIDLESGAAFKALQALGLNRQVLEQRVSAEKFR